MKSKRNYFNHKFSNRLDGRMPGDNVGNRQFNHEKKVPADNIGNRGNSKNIEKKINENIGNSINIAPTHAQSGILLSFDKRKPRKKNDNKSHNKIAGYSVGGVNPLVSGDQDLAQRKRMELSSELKNNHKKGNVRTQKKQDSHDFAKRKKNLASADSKIMELFTTEHEERFKYALTSKPAEKEKSAQKTAEKILHLAGVKSTVKTQLMHIKENPIVIVSIIGEDSLFNKNHLFDILNFLVNKIVNRYPEDRIRLIVISQNEEERIVKNLQLINNENSGE